MAYNLGGPFPYTIVIGHDFIVMNRRRVALDLRPPVCASARCQLGTNHALLYALDIGSAFLLVVEQPVPTILADVTIVPFSSDKLRFGRVGLVNHI